MMMGDFSDFFVREHPRVLSACTALAGDVDVAAEATDEAFARACARWDTVAVMTAPGGWVQTVAINRVRRLQRRRRLELRSRPTRPVDHLPDPELWMLVRSLPQRQQTAVVLAYVHDLPGPAIAAAMGIAPGTVSSTLDAARRTLRRQLTDPMTFEEDLRWST